MPSTPAAARRRSVKLQRSIMDPSPPNAMVNSKNKGNMYININVEVPKGLNSKQKEILRQFDEACGRKNHAKKDSFMKKFFKKD